MGTTSKLRKPVSSRRRVGKKAQAESSERIVQKKFNSLASILEFMKKFEAEHDMGLQQAIITEYAEKVAASEILSLPVDTNGNPDTNKLTPYEKELFEKTTASVVTFINSLLKSRKHAREFVSKSAHTEVNSPYVPLTYPRKNYKVKYRLRMKYIK